MPHAAAHKKRRNRKKMLVVKRRPFTLGRSLIDAKNPNKIFTFRQFVPGTVVGNLATAPADSSNAYLFTLSSLPQAATFLALFDEYRIDGVRVTFLPRSAPVNQVTTVLTPANSSPMYWYSVIDNDDANVPASTAELREYANVRLHLYDGNKVVIDIPHPRPALAAYSGAFTSFGQAPKGMWLDVASPNIQHYGLKLSFPGNGGSATQIYDFQIEYCVSFRGVR